MSSIVARRREQPQAHSKSGWVTSDSREGVPRSKADIPTPPATGDAWLDIADQHFNHPGNAVVVAIGRQKIRYSNGRDGNDLLQGYSGEDSDSELTQDMESALADEEY